MSLDSFPFPTRDLMIFTISIEVLAVNVDEDIIMSLHFLLFLLMLNFFLYTLLLYQS